MNKKQEKRIREILQNARYAQKKKFDSRFYKLNSILGNSNWAVFYGLLGGRMTGKSYSLSDFMCKQSKRLGSMVKQYWMRISESSTKELLSNNAELLVDPDLQRKYNLKLKTKGDKVYNLNAGTDNVEFCRVLPLSKFGKLKGQAYFDKDFIAMGGRYILILDEFQLEQGEKRTSFNILYNFIGMCENLVRTTKTNIFIFLVGNTLEEASTILKAFNFIPDMFGRFYLKSKRCVIDNLPPTEEYLKDRAGSVAEILGGSDLSNYTNSLKKDVSLVSRKAKVRITQIIKFTTMEQNWYCVWDGKIITRYKNQNYRHEIVVAMRPYLHEFYSTEGMRTISDLFNARAFQFDSLITQSYFQDDLNQLISR